MRVDTKARETRHTIFIFLGLYAYWTGTIFSQYSGSLQSGIVSSALINFTLSASQKDNIYDSVKPDAMILCSISSI